MRDKLKVTAAAVHDLTSDLDRVAAGLSPRVCHDTSGFAAPDAVSAASSADEGLRTMSTAFVDDAEEVATYADRFLRTMLALDKMLAEQAGKGGGGGH
ncbi:hypothetical protein [Nocardioides acrostichi]|uniref:Uncharacterized protein n=1 Tax=Nocardioides acrostichi TaxID=2784339 RepID=A0A930V0Z6_9ACTN|nr:hypothetical protein [Nocardioides acrostichi]MBF4161239.1 hypothetical protein [Nocardioides acrostichi]